MRSAPTPQNITRAFLVGCPRSGTTLLQGIVTAHPDVWSLPESHFFEMLEPGRRLPLALGLASRRGWRAFCQIARELDEPVPARWSIGMWRQDSLARRFLSLLDAKTREAGKTLWVEKTPHHIFRIPLITEFVPDARFIHLIRNGRDVVASLYEVTHKYPQAWNGPWELEKCVDYWNRSINVTAKYRRADNHLVVSYERLTADTLGQARRLCDFLGLRPHDDMAAHYAKTASRIVRQDEAWKSNIERGISTQHLSKYFTVFDDQQRALIEQRLSQSVYAELAASAE